MARRTIVLIIIAALVIVGLAAAAYYFLLPREKEPTAPTTVGTVGVNEALNIGGVRWRVTRVDTETSPLVIEQEFFEQSFETEGRFVFVELRAELLDNESSFLSTDELAVIDNEDRIYRTSSEAGGAIAEPERESLPAEVHPNIPVQGFIGFEVAQTSRDLRLRIEREGEIGFVRLYGFSE